MGSRVASSKESVVFTSFVLDWNLSSGQQRLRDEAAMVAARKHRRSKPSPCYVPDTRMIVS
jgi:hypothetical protein